MHGVVPLDERWGLVTKVMNRRLYNTGDIIFREGELGSQAFVLQSGQVRMTRRLEGGETGTLGYVEAGGLFGEMALVDNAPRMATAIAHKPCACIIIPEALLNKKLKDADPMLRVLLLMLIRMVRNAADTANIPADDLDRFEHITSWEEIDFSRADV